MFVDERLVGGKQGLSNCIRSNKSRTSAIRESCPLIQDVHESSFAKIRGLEQKSILSKTRMPIAKWP